VAIEAKLSEFVEDVTLHPSVYLHLCHTDIILKNATEVLGSCIDALHAWPAHSEAVFDAQVRRRVQGAIDSLSTHVVKIGRPERDICRTAIIADHWTEGRAHAKLHPFPLPWFQADAWFDGRAIHMSGVLAWHYNERRKDAFQYIVAHEYAHALEQTEDACDAAAERAVSLSSQSRIWIQKVRMQVSP